MSFSHDLQSACESFKKSQDVAYFQQPHRAVSSKSLSKVVNYHNEQLEAVKSFIILIKC